jgi:hypothetical protein
LVIAQTCLALATPKRTTKAACPSRERFAGSANDLPGLQTICRLCKRFANLRERFAVRANDLKFARTICQPRERFENLRERFARCADGSRTDSFLPRAS